MLSIKSNKKPSLASEKQPKTAPKVSPLVPQREGLPDVKMAHELVTWYYEKYGLITIPAARGSKNPLVPWADIKTYNEAMDNWQYWGDGKPAYHRVTDLNYACLTGPSGVTVIDYDTADFPDYGDKTFKVRTPRGVHCYYRITDKQIGNSVNQERKIDVRGMGGIAILPGSVGSDGVVYSLLDSSPIRDTSYDEFLKIVPWYQETEVTLNPQGWFAETFDTITNKGERDDICTKLAGYLINKGLTVDDVMAIMGAWSYCRCEPAFNGYMKCVQSVAKTHERNNPIVSQTDANEFDSKYNQASTDPSNPFA